MTLSEAIEAATVIIAGYPNGGANAGDSYIGALASTLMAYPRQVAMRCADYPRKLGQPLRGVSAVEKFLPTPAVIIAWCEKETEPLRQAVDREKRAKRQLADRAEFEAPRDDRLTYDELKSKYGDGNGGWGIDRIENTYNWPSPEELAGMVGREEWEKIPDGKPPPSWKKLKTTLGQ